MNIEFRKWPKTPRLNREIIVTEKLDGTNGQINIQAFNRPSDQMRDDFASKGWEMFDIADGFCLAVIPASRNKHISIKKDNYGFAAWVLANVNELVTLGVGRHYGEWWGKGIQRGYEQSTKKFSLFDTHMWSESRPECCDIVPVLYQGIMDTYEIRNQINWLKKEGSMAAPGYMNPEGVCVFHTASSQIYKVLIENDGGHKGNV